MKNTLKIVYYISVVLIIIWLVRPLIFNFFGIEFADSRLETSYQFSWRYTLPIAILLTIPYDLYRKLDNTTKIITSRIVASLFGIFFVYMSLFASMGAWCEEEIYYQDKTNNGKLALVYFNGGAYDSDPMRRYQIRATVPIDDHFNWVFECDTTFVSIETWSEVVASISIKRE